MIWRQTLLVVVASLAALVVLNVGYAALLFSGALN